MYPATHQATHPATHPATQQSTHPAAPCQAVLRRMPRRLLIDLPQEHERAAILRTLLVGEELAPCVDTAAIAAASVGYSGVRCRAAPIPNPRPLAPNPARAC